MVKYKPKLNAQIVHEYFSTTQSINDLSEKYYIGSRIGYLNGFKDTAEALNQRRHKRNFTADFKLNVINYYPTHEDLLAEVATRFDILPSQVST